MKNHIWLVGVVVLVVLSGACAQLSIAPTEQEACCNTVAYEVKVSNPDLLYRRAFTLSAESLDTDQIKLNLQPEMIVLDPGEQEELMVLVKPDCGLAPGDYTIRVTSSCASCEGISQVIEAKLRISGSCVQEPVQEPIVSPTQPEDVKVTEEIPQETTNTTKEINETTEVTEITTPAVVATNSSSDLNTVIIGALFIVLGIFMILVAHMERKSTNIERKLEKVEKLLEDKTK